MQDNLVAIISADGDDIGQLAGRYALADDIDGFRKLVQKINQGNQIFTDWALSMGGSIVGVGGDEIRIEVPIDHLEDLPRLMEQYKILTGHTISMGVGRTLSESEKSLFSAKIRGKNQIVLFSPQVEEDIAKALEQQKNETQKLVEEYLINKSETIPAGSSIVEMTDEHLKALQRRHSQVGFHRRIRGKGFKRPIETDPEHSEAEAVQDLLEHAPIESPEVTHAAKDFEDQLHNLAQSQHQKDQIIKEKEEKDKTNDKVDLKQDIINILKEVKDQVPLLEQVSKENPELGNSIEALIQTVLLMSHKLLEQEQSPELTEKAELKPEESPPSEESKILDKDVEKALPLPEDEAKSRHRHIFLPVGSVKEPGPETADPKHTGAMKVKDSDTGREHWVQIRSGIVLGEAGHASPATRPSGK